jgi:hypothetical protein
MLSCHVAPPFQLPSFIPSFSFKRLVTEEEEGVAWREGRKRKRKKKMREVIMMMVRAGLMLFGALGETFK